MRDFITKNYNSNRHLVGLCVLEKENMKSIINQPAKFLIEGC